MTNIAMPRDPIRHRAGDAADSVQSELQQIQALLQHWAGMEPERLKAACQRLAPRFVQAFPEGTSVVIDLTTCNFVHAPTRTEALKLFISKFGRDAKGWSFDVGVPMRVGAGKCQN
jgi:hypothetical protein